MSDMFSRTELLLGKEKVDILKNSKVAIFGIGRISKSRNWIIYTCR